MARKGPVFQDHHAIEQQTLERSQLLNAISDKGYFYIHASENRIFLPTDPELAKTIGTTPHSGGPIADYQNGLIDRLTRLEQTSDGINAIAGDPDALRRIASRVGILRDTVRIGLINGDLYTNSPFGLRPDDIRPGVQSFFRNEATYRQIHAAQLRGLKGYAAVDNGWAAVTHTEGRVVSTLQYIQNAPNPLTRGGVDELQRNGLAQAISNAHSNGRLTVSPNGIAVVENTLGEEAARQLKVPLGQRGAVSLQLLLGEASASTLVRSGGLLATGADAVLTARRSAELLEQGNATAAQSEVTHALARNVGGWAGGASTAAALGGSGFVPAALVVCDVLLMSKAFDKGADLLDNRAIYHQTDKQGVEWQFNGRNWEREASIDTAQHGRRATDDHPVVSSYEKSQELGALANAKAVELALGKTSPPQDPFNLPARPDDQVGLDNQHWQRNSARQTWERQVRTAASGTDELGSYVVQLASPERAQQLNQEALGRIEHNIATGREAIAAVYLEHHAAQRAQAYGVEVPAAVRAVQAKPGVVLGSDAQLYQRIETGQWAGKDGVASGNLAVELELTNQLRQSSLERAQQALAAIQALPAPTAAQRDHNELLHRYRAAGVDLNVNPQTQQAVELATQRTRQAHGITGPTMQQLQRNASGHYGYDSPIAHLQQGSDGITRVVAITGSDEIRQALHEVQGHRQEPASLGHAQERSADTDTDIDTSTSESSTPQRVLDIQARMQAASAAQERQEDAEQARRAQQQHAAKVRERLGQVPTASQDPDRDEQALQAHAVLDAQRDAEQQREQEQRQVQERQAQTSQQREHQEREETRLQQQRAQDDAQHGQQERQAQEARQDEVQQVEVENRQAHQAHYQQQQTQGLQQQQDRLQESSQQPAAQPRPQDVPLAQRGTTSQVQQEERPQPQARNPHAREHLAPDAQQRLHQEPVLGDPQWRQSAERASGSHVVESGDCARLQVAPPEHLESRNESSQRAESNAVLPALYPNVQMRPAEIEQASVWQQEATDRQEWLAVMPQALPATTESLMASPHAVFAIASRDAEAEQPSPSDAFPVEHREPVPPAAGLAQAHQQSLETSAERRLAEGLTAAPASRAQATPPQDRGAADPGSALFLEESMRSLRQLQQEIALADREDERFHQQWQQHRARGESYPFGHDRAWDQGNSRVEAFQATAQIPGVPSESMAQAGAWVPGASASQTGDVSSHSPQSARNSITDDPDVDEVIHALDSKNELAIQQAMHRVANSAATQALLKKGDDFLEAQAQQEAQEQVATRQALGMDVSAQINTSRGPVMVLTLPEFAKGPMQGGPQMGDGGGDGGGGAGG
ncbi:hypothetical protein [Xanthomonas cucurbitae]|uniref:Large Ala/Gln-rich protein n=1 Tax=Xanthomonas cucurbitae TaxID=56453 RepID=A0ABY7YGZ5_9XANT|nr:hypothetical protein [Xanthomonas cucurbitae]WDM69217.1 hypothetical protein K6981_08305 [Xanthomonas cucurbitae]WDM73089.1 hypothetical protein K6978_08275 [Xanthomonas cucurbitae]